jgi:Tfp pilus assembly PilM family ATPase
MNALGIYFGPQLISIIETKGSKPINYIQVSQSTVSAGELLEEKVPVPVKLIALLKDELMRNNIEANEAIVSISGKDLIVRTFEMPIMPRQELDTAVNFELKKYIPFKIEDLISDFQYKLDKTIQKTRVLFVGIKKEALDNYLNILSQLGIKIKSIEYSAFSILRLLKLADIKEKGIIAVVNIDITKDDEANFVVLDDGFPLFSRDISLMAGYEEVVKAEETQQGVILEKLKREIQISLDYYDRKFPGKNISKIFFITNPDYRADLDGFIKELGLDIHFIDINKYIDKPILFSLAFVKGYSSSLSKIDIAVKINLLSAKERVTKKTAAEALTPLSWVMRFKSDVIVAAVCFSIFIVIFLSGLYRISPLQEELNNIINIRPAASTISGGLSYKELLDINSNYKMKAEAMDNIIKNRLYLTPLLDAIPRVVPKGIRLVNLSFKEEEEKNELILEGTAYLGDSDKELELVNAFLSRLKENSTLTEYFKEMSVVSTGHKQIEKASITNFIISCQGYKKDKQMK